jgi:hypothetical protein
LEFEYSFEFLEILLDDVATSALEKKLKNLTFGQDVKIDPIYKFENGGFHDEIIDLKVILAKIRHFNVPLPRKVLLEIICKAINAKLFSIDQFLNMTYKIEFMEQCYLYQCPYDSSLFKVRHLNELEEVEHWIDTFTLSEIVAIDPRFVGFRIPA